MAKMNPELRNRKSAIQRALGALREERNIAFSRWFGAQSGTKEKKTWLREYYAVLAAIRELRYEIQNIKRTANHAR